MPIRKPILTTAIGAVLLFFGVAHPTSFWRKVDAGVGADQVCGVAMSPSGQHIVINAGFTAYSSDGGITWDTAVGFATDIMDYGDEKHVFGAGTGQNGFVGVNRSFDYGKTWELIELPMNLINFGDVKFVDSVHGWAAGNKDFIVVTNDGWQTWSTKTYGVFGYRGGRLSFLDTLRGFVAGWLVGTDSTILKTTDGGNSWSALPTGIFSLAGISLDFVGSLNGWLVGLTDERRLYHSTDGGQSWIEQSPLGGFGFIEMVDAVDDLNAWVLANASNPRIWRTSDAGESWILEYEEPGGSLLDFVMINNIKGVAVGNLGSVLVYDPVIMLGDLNTDQQITTTDVVLELNLVFLGQSALAPDETGDVNCDSALTAVDVVLELNRAFLENPFPCN